MSLGPEDFYSSFSDRELKAFPLETMGGESIYLRALSYNEKKRFKRGIELIAKKLSRLSKDMAENDFQVIWNNDIQDADDYLIPASMCDSSGNLMWKDNREGYNKFLENKSAVVEEIIYHINEFNNLSGSFVPSGSEDELKKNEK